MAANFKQIIPVSRTMLRRFFEQPFAYDFLIAWFALLGGIAYSERAYRTSEHLPGWLWRIAAAGVLLFTIGKIWVQWSAVKGARSVRSLEGCLLTHHSIIANCYRGKEDPLLRLTLHIP